MAVSQELLEKRKFTLEEIQQIPKSEVFAIVQETFDALVDEVHGNDCKLLNLYKMLVPMARCVLENTQDDPSFAKCYESTFNAAVLSALQDLCHSCFERKDRQHRYEETIADNKEIIEYIYQHRVCTYSDLFQNFMDQVRDLSTRIHLLEKDGVIALRGINDKLLVALGVDFLTFYENKKETFNGSIKDKSA